MGDVFIWGLFDQAVIGPAVWGTPRDLDAVGVFLRNAAFARYRVDPQRWPATADYVDRVLAQECFTRLQPCEAIMMRTPIRDQRAALAAAGAPLSATTVGSDTPRRGVMRT